MKSNIMNVLPLVMAFVFFPASAFAGRNLPPIEFSAEYVELYEGEIEAEGKFHAGPMGVRMEGIVEGEPHLMIVSFEKGVTWIVQKDDRTYLEMPFNPEDSGFTTPCAELNVKQTLVGRESLHGRGVEKWHCEKWDGSIEKVWFDERLKMSTRTQAPDGAVFEMRNIKEGGLPADLFQPPAGFTKIGMP